MIYHYRLQINVNGLHLLELESETQASDTNDSLCIPNEQCVHMYTGPMWVVTSVKERGGEKTPLGIIHN
jgi:hypothetical protein